MGGVSDPLRWWPGKYAECKRIARLVEESIPSGEVLECGGLEIFADLLPCYRVTTARVADGIDLCHLPYEDDRFDIGVSARVVELLPPRLRRAYLLELLRVSRYWTFVALPLQPELEAIDKIKNTYIWDTTRVWQHPGLRPQDLEELLEGRKVCVSFHVDPPGGADLTQFGASREVLHSLLAASALDGDDFVPALSAPAFVVAEISKLDAFPLGLASLGQEAH